MDAPVIKELKITEGASNLFEEEVKFKKLGMLQQRWLKSSLT
jgi:hypothetical protein